MFNKSHTNTNKQTHTDHRKTSKKSDENTVVVGRRRDEENYCVVKQRGVEESSLTLSAAKLRSKHKYKHTHQAGQVATTAAATQNSSSPHPAHSRLRSQWLLDRYNRVPQPGGVVKKSGFFFEGRSRLGAAG